MFNFDRFLSIPVGELCHVAGLNPVHHLSAVMCPFRTLIVNITEGRSDDFFYRFHMTDGMLLQLRFYEKEGLPEQIKPLIHNFAKK